MIYVLAVHALQRQLYLCVHCVYACAVCTWISLFSVVCQSFSFYLSFIHSFAHFSRRTLASWLSLALYSAHSSYIAKAFNCYALSNGSQPKMYLVSTAQDAHSQNLHQIMNNMDAQCTHNPLIRWKILHCTNREQLVEKNFRRQTLNVFRTKKK